jgi:hypothetical protein
MRTKFISYGFHLYYYFIPFFHGGEEEEQKAVKHKEQIE